MCFLKGFVLACCIHLSLSQGTVNSQNSPNSPLLDPSVSNSNTGAQGLVIPNNFQAFGTGDTATNIWTRRQGSTQTSTLQTSGTGQTNQAAGGMVVHPFQNVQNFGGSESISSNKQTTVQHGGGTPVQFPGDSTNMGSRLQENIIPSSKNNLNTNVGTNQNTLLNNNNNGQTATGLQVPFSAFNSNSNTNTGNAGSSSTGSESVVPFTAFSIETNVPQTTGSTSTGGRQTNINNLQNTGSTSTGIQIPMTTFNTDKPGSTGRTSTTTRQQSSFNSFSTNSLLNNNAGNTGSGQGGAQQTFNNFNTNTNNMLNKDVGTFNTNTNALQNKNTGSATGIQIPMNTFNENTNSLLNKNNQNTGGGVQVPFNAFNAFNANTNTNSLINENALNTGVSQTTNFFTANTNRLPNENMLKSGSMNAMSNQLPNKNSVLTPVGVQNTNNVVVQNSQQAFSQVGKTAFDNNANNAFNPNLNSALGFGNSNNINNNNNNLPTTLPHGTPCVDSLIKPAYIKTRAGNMVFDPTHFKLGSSKLRCATGTGFSLQTCACEFITDSKLAAFYASIGAADWATRCNEDFSIDFNRGIYDNSLDQWYVANYGVNTSHGVGVFTGLANTSVALPRYRGYDLKTIAFEFRFRSNITHREHPHPLFTNCEGHAGHYIHQNQKLNEEPTYGVILNSNRPKMTFFVTYEKARPKQTFGEPVLHTQYISMDVNPLVWNTVRFSYDGNLLTAYLNGQKESKPAKGVIAERMEHEIVIGHCLRYGQFVGEIDDVKVYSQCIPSRFK